MHGTLTSERAGEQLIPTRRLDSGPRMLVGGN
jgi:hypothetical protein